MKATAIQDADGVWRDLQKMPKTDKSKASLKGRVTVVSDGGKLVVGPIDGYASISHVIYRDGEVGLWTFDEVRKRARA